jgi:hypothetical protein
MAGDLAILAYTYALLNFNKGTHLGTITNGATVKVCKNRDLDILSQYDIGADATKFHAQNSYG